MCLHYQTMCAIPVCVSRGGLVYAINKNIKSSTIQATLAKTKILISPLHCGPSDQ